MEALNLELYPTSIELELQNHPAWLGYVSGLKADKMLRGKAPYTFVIRAGEFEGNYYASHVLEDGTIRHTPFVVTITPHGWHFENACGWGPYLHANLDVILPGIMHCKKEDVIPLIVK